MMQATNMESCTARSIFTPIFVENLNWFVMSNSWDKLNCKVQGWVAYVLPDILNYTVIEKRRSSALYTVQIIRPASNNQANIAKVTRVQCLMDCEGVNSWQVWAVIELFFVIYGEWTTELEHWNNVSFLQISTQTNNGSYGNQRLLLDITVRITINIFPFTSTVLNDLFGAAGKHHSPWWGN